MRQYILTVLIVCTALQSPAQRKADTVVTGTDRKEILDALRAVVSREVGVRARFVVQTLQRADCWVLVQVHPVQENGADINYRKTKYYLPHQDQIDGGFFDDHVLALLRLGKGKWRIVEYEIGATDYSGEYWLEKHGISKLFE